ncbi:hypothetical protein XENOCAPTIV_028116, partial [Xenoophorus captivus]
TSCPSNMEPDLVKSACLSTFPDCFSRPSSLDAYVFGHLAPILKCKLPNGKLQQHLKSLDNLTDFCSNILLLYFPRDGRENSGEKTSPQPDAADFDNVPNKRRKQFLSAVFAFAAMLSYALLTGMTFGLSLPSPLHPSTLTGSGPPEGHPAVHDGTTQESWPGSC